jgi:hypothetical protein
MKKNNLDKFLERAKPIKKQEPDRKKSILDEKDLALLSPKASPPTRLKVISAKLNDIGFKGEEITNFPRIGKHVVLDAVWNNLKNPPEFMGAVSRVNHYECRVELKTNAKKINKIMSLFHAQTFGPEKIVAELRIDLQDQLTNDITSFHLLGILKEIGQIIEQEGYYFVFQPDYFTSI